MPVDARRVLTLTSCVCVALAASACHRAAPGDTHHVLRIAKPRDPEDIFPAEMRHVDRKDPHAMAAYVAAQDRRNTASVIATHAAPGSIAGTQRVEAAMASLSPARKMQTMRAAQCLARTDAQGRPAMTMEEAMIHAAHHPEDPTDCPAEMRKD